MVKFLLGNTSFPPTQTYDTAINDFLTIGTERGILILSVFISTFLMMAGAGLWIGHRYGNAILSACGAAILAAFVACCFSTMLFQSELWVILVIAIAVMAFFGIWTCVSDLWTRHRKKEPSSLRMRWPQIRTFLLLWIFGTATTGTLIYASSSLALRDLPALTTLEGDGLREFESHRVGKSRRAPSSILKQFRETGNFAEKHSSPFSSERMDGLLLQTGQVSVRLFGTA